MANTPNDVAPTQEPYRFPQDLVDPLAGALSAAYAGPSPEHDGHGCLVIHDDADNVAQVILDYHELANTRARSRERNRLARALTDAHAYQATLAAGSAEHVAVTKALEPIVAALTTPVQVGISTDTGAL